MNPPKVTDDDYINFIIATPRDVTATEVEWEQRRSGTRLLARLEPDSETLWQEGRTQIDLTSGIIIFDDSTLEKPICDSMRWFIAIGPGKQKVIIAR